MTYAMIEVTSPVFLCNVLDFAEELYHISPQHTFFFFFS